MYCTYMHVGKTAIQIKSVFLINYLLYIPIAASLPTSLPSPSLSPSPHLRKGKASHGYQPAMVYEVAVKLGASSLEARQGLS